MTATSLMQDVGVIADAANNLGVIKAARAAFAEGINNSDIPAVEKAKAIALFEKEFALGILQSALNAASDIELKNAQAQAALGQAAAANAQAQSALAQAQGFKDNLRVQAATTYANYAALAANNNIMTSTIAGNMKILVKAIVDDSISLDTLA
jgi:hypothetical protein